MVAVLPPGCVTVSVPPSIAVIWPTTVGSTTTIAVTVYVPSAARCWPRWTLSPTARSPTAILAPPLVMVVASVTATVRVQPSSVLSATFEPLMAVIVMSLRPKPKPKPPKPSRRPGLPPKPWRGRSGFVVPGAALAARAGADGSAPVPEVVAGSVAADGDGDAPIAAITPTATRSADPATIPARAAAERARDGR